MANFALPHSVGMRDPDSLYGICACVVDSADALIELDCSQVQSVDPHGLAVLGALLSRLPDKRFAMPWLSPPVCEYLTRMHFFDHFEIEGVLAPECEPLAPPTVQLTVVRDAVDSDRVATRLADAITGNLTSASRLDALDPNTGKNEYYRYQYPIWYALSELIENAVTHGRRFGWNQAAVWVAAEYYQNSGEVKLAVVDNGCGILRTLLTHPLLREPTHLEAVKAALQPLVSCNRDGQFGDHANQGVGLTTAYKISRAAKGHFHIASGNAQFSTRSHTGGEILKQNGDWQGVAVALTCNRHELPRINVGMLMPQEPTAVRLKFVD